MHPVQVAVAGFDRVHDPLPVASRQLAASRANRTASAKRLRGGTTDSPASSTASTSDATIAAAPSAAAYIAPYTPLRT